MKHLLPQFGALAFVIFFLWLSPNTAMGAKPPCAANPGYIANNSTTPGLHTWTVGTDLTDPSTNQEIIFSVVYYGAQPGPTFDYALLLVDASNKIVAYHTDSDPDFGNFDFSVLPPGAYRVGGLSYSQSNSPADVDSYLQNLIAQGHPSDLGVINLDSYVTGGSFCLYYNSAPDNASSVYISSSTYALSGQVTRSDGSPLAGVTVQVEGDANTSAITNAGGFYQISGLPGYGVYYLRANKMTEASPPTTSLSVADMLRLQDHILQIMSLGSVCEMVSADINSSSGLTTFDRVIMARRILGIPNEFRWNIVPASVVAQSPDLGFNPIIETGQLTADGQFDFVAFWPGAFQNCGITPVYIPAVLSVAPQLPASTVYAGATIEVPIIAGQMDNIPGMQFSVQFDPAVLTLTGIQKGINFNNALTNAENATNLAQANTIGSMGFVWIKQEVVTPSYPAGEELVRLIFQVNGPAGNTTISISDSPAPAFTADDQYRLSPILKGTLQVLVCDPQSSPSTGLNCANPTAGIGSATGTAVYDPGTGVFTLTSTGTMYNPNQDNVWMVPYQLCGDGEFYAEVTGVTNGFAGVMMREDLDTDSKKVAILTNGGNSYRREIRMNKGGNTTFTNTPRPNPRWVRLTRVGNNFTAYTSSDGMVWTLAFSVTIPMNTCIYVGMATFSNNQTMTVTATFDNVTLIDYSPLVAPPVTFLAQQPFDVALYPNPSAGEVHIGWPITTQETQTTVKITDRWGRVVYSQPHHFEAGDVQKLDFSEWATGMYFFSILADEKIVWQGKWMKE